MVLVNKPRKQVYVMDMYLAKMKDMDIRSDAEVQRYAGEQFTSEIINGLLETVLTGDYTPSLILGEEYSGQLWIIDGLQRSTSWWMFRYGGYKITKNVEHPIIVYKTKKKDQNGNIVKDSNGNIVWEDIEFDIRNKKYDDLPEELKKRFNEYQVETVIHENCDMKRISMLIRRYNNHVAMNVTQRAFTYIDNFAREIRSILDMNFFNSFDVYSEKKKSKGEREKIVIESVMCMFHFNDWKKQTKQLSSFLNENSSMEEFEIFASNVSRLENIFCDEMRELFVPKNAFIWFSIFNKFTKMNIEDCKFADFVKEFVKNLKYKKIDGVSFMDLEENRGTRDKGLIDAKLNLIETLMNTYLDFNKSDLEEVNTLELIREIVDPEVTEEDMSDYEEDLEVMTLDVNNESRLLEERNKPSLLAMIAYGYKQDTNIDDWFTDYFDRVDMYTLNQKKNFTYMVDDFKNYMDKQVVAYA